MWSCSKCENKNPETARFCTGCGAAMPPPTAATPAPPAGKRCAHCGVAMNADAGFCTECGTRVGQAGPAAAVPAPVAANPVVAKAPPVVPAAAPPVVPAPVAVKAPPAAVAAVPSAPMAAKTAPPPPPGSAPMWEPLGPPPGGKTPPAAAPAKKAPIVLEPTVEKSGSGGLIALIGLLLLALGGAGFFGYRYYVNRTAAIAQAPVAESTPPAPAPATPPAETATPAPAPETPPADTAVPPPTTPPVKPATPRPARPKPGDVAKPPAAAGGTPSLPMAAAPQTQAPETPAPAPRKPPTPAPAPGYHGPSDGLVLWSGPLPKNENVVVDGGTTTVGSILSGSLPGVPVNLSIEPKDVVLAEAPSAANGWKRFAFIAKKGRKTVVTIQWTLAK
jgi:Double zinc ribbon